jgi:putative oxidoreductase
MLHGFIPTTLVPLVLRFGLAVIFIYHGLEKVAGEGNELGAGWYKGPDGPGGVVQLLVAWGELIGGVAVAVGFLTRIAALGLAVIMLGAIATVHGQHGFSLAKQGYEYNFAILIICTALILLGPGPLAVDRFVRLRRKPI